MSGAKKSSSIFMKNTGVTGPVFAERGFGFAVQAEADLAETINRSLLAVIESGDYDSLHEKWFGASGGN